MGKYNIWRLCTLDIMRLIFRKGRLELYLSRRNYATSVEQDYYTASAAFCKLAKLTIFDEIIREKHYEGEFAAKFSKSFCLFSR